MSEQQPNDLPLRSKAGLALLELLSRLEQSDCEREQKGYACRPLGCTACFLAEVDL